MRTIVATLRFPGLDEEVRVRPAVGATIENEFLRYEPGREEARRKVRDVIAALAIERPEDLARFYTEHGPLFDVNPVSMPWALSLTGYLFALGALHAKMDREIPDAGFIADWLLEWVQRAQEQYPGQARFAGVMTGADMRFELVPLQQAQQDALGAALHRALPPWPVFAVPKQWPDTRDAIVTYAKRQLLANLTAWLARNVTFRATEEGALTFQPANLYTYLLLAAMAPLLAPLRKCACGCGKLAQGKSKYAPGHKRRGLSTMAKRDVAAYFRLQRSRGKITPRQYEAVRRELERAWARGIRDKEQLRRAGWRALGKRLE